MKKLIKNKIYGSVNNTRMYCSRKTGQMLRLLFMYRTWTVAASGRKRVKIKKKKKKNAATETQETRTQTHTHSIWKVMVDHRQEPRSFFELEYKGIHKIRWEGLKISATIKWIIYQFYIFCARHKALDLYFSIEYNICNGWIYSLK